MRVVVQRVKNASVTVDNIVRGKIDNGLLTYVGFDSNDTINDLLWCKNKIINLRIFNDENDKMNLSVMDKGYDILVVSQFTLLASCKKGRRPSYDRAANPGFALELYNEFLKMLKESSINIQSGVFQAHMDVDYRNDGPVTIIIDSNE